MLDTMREGSKGIAAKVILGVIILSFALMGVSGYLGGSSKSAAVVVNGQEISQVSIDTEYKNERSRLQQQYGEQFDILAANPNFTQQVKAQATQKLVSDALISQAISEMGLRVGDEQVKDKIRNMAEFQIDGKFNNAHYLALLRQASYTPATFSESLKNNLARRQLLQMLVGSEFILPVEVAAAEKLQAQKRIAKVLTVPVAKFDNTGKIKAAEINTYYENNKQQFQYPEKVSLDYILLDGATLVDQIALTQEEIETYYDHHQSDYQRAERRKVAHILVKGTDQASKQKAQAILSDLKKGANFAKLAMEKSDDSYSAKNKGVLDWFERGVMDPAFDEAAFSLTKAAPLSDLVKSQFGFHLIKLIDIEKSKSLSFADVTPQVKKALQDEKASDLYYELKQKMGDTAFESPDSLDETAAIINGKIVHTKLFSADKAPELLINKDVLKVAFDADFRGEGMNSELIELSENVSIVVRVNEYKAGATKPLADVSDLIELQLETQLAREQAKTFATLILTKLNASESIAPLLAQKNIEFSSALTFDRFANNYDYQVIEKVFKLAKPSAEKASRDWVTTSTGDFAVIELSKVVDAKSTDAKMSSQLESILARSTSEATYQALINQLMENADIEYFAVK